MVKIKDRVNKKMNIISPKEDISCVKFKSSTLNELLDAEKVEVNQYGDFIEFHSSNDRGSIKFCAYKNEGYKVILEYAFAKLFSFENDVVLTDSQMNDLQCFINDYLIKNDFNKLPKNKKINKFVN